MANKTKKVFEVLSTTSYGNDVLIIYNETEGFEVNRYDGQMLKDFHSTLIHIQSDGHIIKYVKDLK